MPLYLLSLVRKYLLKGVPKGLPKPIIYTLGTSTHSREDFLELLRHYQIEAVVDVRSFPQSRLEHFKKGNLARILKEGGYNYLYLVNELGGFRKGGYLSYTKTLPYQEGISYLEHIGNESITSFICAERFH